MISNALYKYAFIITNISSLLIALKTHNNIFGFDFFVERIFGFNFSKLLI